MDVQGTRFHLLHGAADWGACIDRQLRRTLGELQGELAHGLPSTDSTDLEFDQTSIRLRRDTPLFRRSGRRTPLDPASRRGAGVDGYGNWFWIGDDPHEVRLQTAGAKGSTRFWPVFADALAQAEAGDANPMAAFARADDGLAPASDLKANFLGHLNRIYGKSAAPPPGGLKGDFGFIVE